MPFDDEPDFKLGTTFHGNVIIDNHLHVVISKPFVTEGERRILLIFVSTYSGRSRTEEDVCMIYPSDRHPFIKNTSTVVYNRAAEISLDTLAVREAEGFISRQPDFSRDVIRRILRGTTKSRYFKHGFLQILMEQKLLDDLDD